MRAAKIGMRKTYNEEGLAALPRLSMDATNNKNAASHVEKVSSTIEK